MAPNWISEDDAPSECVEAPYGRVIKHLAAPWTLGTKNLWLGTSTVFPGQCSNLHSHSDLEEVFYCLSGQGRIRIDDNEVILKPGVTAYVPPDHNHQLINDGPDNLKLVCVASPPFTPQTFRTDHNLD